MGKNKRKDYDYASKFMFLPFYFYKKMLLCITTAFGNKVDSMYYLIVW